MKKPSSTESTNAPVSAATDEHYVLLRHGNTPLRFRGCEIGEGIDQRVTNDFFRRVTLFRTTGGNYVAQTVFDAAFKERVEYAAHRANTADDIIAWLRDPEGVLGWAATMALLIAAKNDPGFAAAYGEDVP